MEPEKIRPPHRFWLLTYPRTASNLLLRILSLEDQSNLVSHSKTSYYFVPTMRVRMGPNGTYGKHLDYWTSEQRNSLMSSYQTSFENLQQQITVAEVQSKDLFIKEHISWMIEPVAETKFVFGDHSTDELPWTVKMFAQQTRSNGNETALPDEFLKMWFPTFLIRHPALAFPSIYRTCVDNEGIEAAKAQVTVHSLEMTLHWSRTLYDWYKKYFDQLRSSSTEKVDWPIILDADDVMTEPKLLRRYCNIVGFDPTKLKTSWATASQQELDKMDHMERRMRSTLSASTGIIDGKTSTDLEIDEEAKKWRVEFGDEQGLNMQKWVRLAMPDYEYLKARRLRVHT